MNTPEFAPTIVDRPTRDEWRAFAARLLHAAGLGALGAGLIFFVAANWQAWGPLGRFGLLQAGLLLCIAAALWRAPPQRIGQATLLLATLFTGALLALFGQSYQTGADVHELFFTWALLSLPFALVASSGAVWALWWCVLNAGLALLCGVLGVDHLFWRVIGGWGLGRASLLMLPCLINLGAAGLFLMGRRTRFAAAAPLWLQRLLLALGLSYGSAAALLVVTGEHGHSIGEDAPVLALYTALSVALATGTWLRRQDVFALTLLAASWIAISTAWLATRLHAGDLGELFIIAMWLIASSTAAGMLLMRSLRQWRSAATDGVAS